MHWRTLKYLLEEPRNPFEVPDSYRVGKPEGVGKKEAVAQMGWSWSRWEVECSVARSVA